TPTWVDTLLSQASSATQGLIAPCSEPPLTLLRSPARTGCTVTRRTAASPVTLTNPTTTTSTSYLSPSPVVMLEPNSSHATLGFIPVLAARSLAAALSSSQIVNGLAMYTDE